MFFSPSFKFITRNPEKLLFIIDYVLRYGGTLMTLNYLFSPTYLARRNPLIRPAHYTSEIEALVANPDGLRVCSKSPISGSVSVDACIETDLGTSPRSAGGASTESC